MVGVGSLPSGELTASGTGSSWVLQWAGSPEGQRRGRSVRWASRAPLLFSRSQTSITSAIVVQSLSDEHHERHCCPGAQSCPTLCDPMACSTTSAPAEAFPESQRKWKVKVKSLSHVRLFATLWAVASQAPRSVAISFSRGSSWPRDRTQVSHVVGRYFTVWATESQGSSLQTEMSDTGAFLPGASRVTSGRLRTLSIRFLSCKNGVITPSPPHQDVMRYDLCHLGNPKPSTQSVLSQVPWAPSPLGT